MPKLINKTDNKSDEQFIIMKSAIEFNKQEMKSNRQDSDNKMMKLTKYVKVMLAEITDHINTLKFPPTQKDLLNSLEPTTVVLANTRDPPLDGGKSKNIWWHVNSET